MYNVYTQCEYIHYTCVYYTIYNIQYTYLDVVKLSDGHIHVYIIHIYTHVRYILFVYQYCIVNHAESKDLPK